MGLRSDLFQDGKAVDIAMLDEMAKQASEPEPLKQDPEPISDEQLKTPLSVRLIEKVNPFPILVYNLLLADMMEAIAYGMSIKWVVADGIYAPSPTCWAQGWFGSTSNLAASLLLSAISINSFLTIVLGYRMPRWGLYTCIGGIWTFVLLVNAAGVLQAEKGHFRTASGESYFMRANVWCWISSEYNSWRLWSHYAWIIVSVTLSVSLYVAIFCILFIQKRNCRHLPKRKSRTPGTARLEPEAPTRSDYHPAFLAYPFVYLCCISPLVIGRIALILGKDLGIHYFAFAGSILAAHGLLNSILWTSTILFSASEDMEASGLNKFSFVRTPARDYGHTVIISGPASKGYTATDGKEKTEWWWWRSGGLRSWRSRCENAHEKLNPDLIRIHTAPTIEGPYIHMDVVTRIVIEDAEGNITV
ncbi:hypothetical protein N0V93_008359 [Gnomoniopsis smithogilvyi]|uniref:Integral membrane protein n=1 Tax=Gnomoniopsis smithogilvyi TaxID=1191159 RepID=A0A9W8YP01_9PEZI|nr:hypothetical protein N0V93_008359 [Gnomoniopsis smithogilvyi]